MARSRSKEAQVQRLPCAPLKRGDSVQQPVREDKNRPPGAWRLDRMRVNHELEVPTAVLARVGQKSNRRHLPVLSRRAIHVQLVATTDGVGLHPGSGLTTEGVLPVELVEHEAQVLH